jgi:hypothetical protein
MIASSLSVLAGRRGVNHSWEKCNAGATGTRFAVRFTMPRKKSPPRLKRSNRRDRTSSRRLQEELGPPPHEAVVIRTDREREAAADLRLHTATSPKLSGGDVDADWQRAASVGEEAVGGTVTTPDQSVVDELGDALGVSRAADEEFRSSQEILERRDQRRADQEG